MREPGRRVGKTLGDGIGEYSGVAAGQQVGEQPADAGQTPADGTRRQAYLAVLEPNDLSATTRRALLLQKREHVGRLHVGGLFSDNREEHLEIEGSCQPGVGASSGSHKGQVIVEHRVAERDGVWSAAAT